MAVDLSTLIMNGSSGHYASKARHIHDSHTGQNNPEVLADRVEVHLAKMMKRG